MMDSKKYDNEYKKTTYMQLFNSSEILGEDKRHPNLKSAIDDLCNLFPQDSPGRK